LSMPEGLFSALVYFNHLARMNAQRIFFIVDDDIDDQELLKEAINEVDGSIRCLSASNCEEALDLLKSRRIPEPELIFLDLNMPLMSGRQFLEGVNENAVLASIPIIVLSTSADQNTKASVLELGARQFITKPDKYSEWEKMLCDILSAFQIKT